MSRLLWISEGLLVVVFTFSAVTKGLWSRERLLAAGQTGVAAVPMQLVRVIAVAELLGVVGLVAPQLVGVWPAATSFAAIGLGLVMVGATITHLRQDEPGTALVNVALLGLCLFVAIASVRR